VTATGPWFFSPIDDCTVAIVEEDGSAVFDMMAGLHSTGQAALESHARLVSAAPALLAALQQIMDGVAGCQKDPQYAAARAAIAQAMGGQQ
jgi:hypothetical protein